MGRILVAGLLGLLGAAALAGCRPDLGAAPFLCNSGTPRCPGGYTCKGNRYCVKEGTCPETVPGCQTPSSCGDGTCDVGEDAINCGQDCQAGDCGNGSCDAGETAKTCPKDCHCGDGACGPEEGPESCPADCPVSTCGDGRCLSPETHKSCPADCPAVCGDGACDVGETSQSCPKDCPAIVCGNGKCETGETAASCPSDCATCTNDATQCEGTDKVKICTGGAWQSQDCKSLCVSGGYDYTTGCSYSSTKKADVCVCGEYAGFGDLCDDELECDPSLICVAFGSASDGFCTKYCTTTCSGEPAGTYATCSLDIGGQYACAFECSYSADCPGTLFCDDWEGICKP